MRFTSALGIGLASAASCARLPAPMMMEPAGSRYSPMRLSRIKL
jgi:hypothetical protein